MNLTLYDSTVCKLSSTSSNTISPQSANKKCNLTRKLTMSIFKTSYFFKKKKFWRPVINFFGRQSITSEGGRKSAELRRLLRLELVVLKEQKRKEKKELYKRTKKQRKERVGVTLHWNVIRWSTIQTRKKIGRFISWRKLLTIQWYG